jgi:COP9 signalosome complex subunit 3
MDQVVGAIRDLSQKESDHEQLKKTLETNIDKLRNQAHHVTNALQQLDPAKHSLGIVYLLFAKATTREIDQSFLSNVEFFLSNLNGKHTRKVPSRFSYVCHQYMEICRDNSFVVRGIKNLKIGIERFRPSSEFLTPLHADYLCLCLKAKNYKAGYNLIENNKIYDIDPNQTGLTPRDMLLYYYYGGMIYIGVKQYQKALQFFDTALTVPAFALNAIMVEVFKKYVLVSLLTSGKFTGISKHATNLVHRHMKTFCSQYVDFANAYGTYDMDKLKKVAAENEELFKKDNNFGLIKQCISALFRRNIQRLTATYMTLSLADIAKNVGLPTAKHAEQVLLRMIENGEINAIINQKDGMVSFEEDIQAFNSPQTSAILEKRIDQSISLANRLKNIDEEISSSTGYIARLYGIREEMFGDFERGSSSRGIGFRRMFEFFK